MSYIVNALISVMDAIYKLTSSWGLSIIGLTLLVRLVMLPFTIVQARSSQKMALIQPELQKVQKKYKDDPERLNIEIAELYRREGVNPFSSCLLLIIQLPILMAMVRALEAHPALKTATFLSIPLALPEKKILPLIAVVTTYLAMKFSPTMGASGQQQGSQNAMMIGMLGVIWYFCFKYAAAVSIYIITANVASFLERFVVPRVEKAGEGTGSK